MTKRNKKRYQSKGNPWPRLPLSGQVYLKHADEEALSAPVTGDLCCFLHIENNPHYQERGSYFETGMAGYFRADVFDGKRFKPVDLSELLPGREHHFRKSEQPIDTFELIRDLLGAMQGRKLMRTYREHYTLETEEAETAES